MVAPSYFMDSPTSVLDREYEFINEQVIVLIAIIHIDMSVYVECISHIHASVQWIKYISFVC